MRCRVEEQAPRRVHAPEPRVRVPPLRCEQAGHPKVGVPRRRRERRTELPWRNWQTRPAQTRLLFGDAGSNPAGSTRDVDRGVSGSTRGRGPRGSTRQGPVGESGRPRRAVYAEIAGSNPAVDAHLLRPWGGSQRPSLMRVWCSTDSTTAFQAGGRGSNPLTRSDLPCSPSQSGGSPNGWRRATGVKGVCFLQPPAPRSRGVHPDKPAHRGDAASASRPERTVEVGFVGTDAVRRSPRGRRVGEEYQMVLTSTTNQPTTREWERVVDAVRGPSSRGRSADPTGRGVHNAVLAKIR